MHRIAAKRSWHREEVCSGRAQRIFWWCEVMGAKPGPTLAVIAGQHGMEPTGSAVLADFLFRRGDVRPVRMPWDGLVIPHSEAGDLFRKGQPALQFIRAEVLPNG